jgi:predicted  nucleic acid-binding Zn-ribbon protein
MQNVTITWGPALLVCLAVLVGMIYNNARITDLKDALNKRIDSLEFSLNKRIDSLESRLGRIEDRLTKVEERLGGIESPIKLR